ncbi:hypothetical protein HN51_000647 [Arachis hypogaea]|uniref:uncharacterized protein isoform X1 n=1 Tax=Arachis hypogaea TaxID=3818 RepID=UPI0010FC4818|nr:uncharacterized protein LOC112800525 isoform X1 [Arachis hypogaea]QHO48622.1 uncharacterized protein DS421_1g06990 [Arachis hypogaea]
MSRAFSIRGYAFIMRSRDVFQCWPFPTSDATAEQVRSWLPPMTVPNWTTDHYDDSELRSNRIASGEQENENPPSDAAASRESKSSEKSPSQEEEGEAEKLEIQAVDDAVSHGDNGKRESEKSEKLPEEEEVEKLENPAVVETACQGDDGERESEKLDEEEEEKLEMVCPVCGDFKAATLTAVNVHMDGCLREDRRRRQMKMSKLKSKSKAPKKKRYIAEIFNVEDEEEKLEQEENLMEEEEEEELENERPEIETEMKFWPFGEDVSVTVEKFRWLSRRLEELRSKGTTGGGSQSMRSEGGKTNTVSEDSLSSPEEEEEKLEMVCPVCRVFKAATVTAANAHIDGCLAQAMREERWQIRKKLGSNLKPKTQKKRSLTEILNVAPQIDTGNCDAPVDATVDEEEDNMERGAGKRKKNTKKNPMKKKKKIMVKKKSKVQKRVCLVPLSTKSKMVKMKKPKKKKRKNKKNLFNDEFAATKEDASKSKVQRSATRSTKQKGVDVEVDVIDASLTHEKKLDLKILPEEKKEQVSCDSVEKLQKAVSPIRGILKNHKHISRNTSSGGCNVQEGTEEESHCDIQVPTSDKHVRFSGKDYTLGPKDRSSFDETATNLASDASESSFANEHCSESEAEATRNSEAKKNDDNNAINKDKGKEVCPIAESKQFCNVLGQVAAQNFLQPCTNQEKSKHISEKGQSSPSNVAFHDKSDRGNTTPLHCSPYAFAPRSLPAVQTGQVSGVNTQVPESEAFISTRKFVDHMEDRTIKSATTNLNSNSNSNTRTFLGPSSSYSTSFNKANERPEFQPHNYGDNGNNGKALSSRPSFSIFNADMSDNSNQFLGQGKANARENLMDQNFIGLPLNSHGELINFSSNSISGKAVMNQQPDKSCILKGYFNAPMKETSHQNSQQHSSIGARNVVQKTVQDRLNPFPHYPARLGVTELHGSSRTNIFQQNSDSRSSGHLVQLLDPGLNLARSYPVERDKTPNYMGNGMIYPKESSGPIAPSAGPSRQPTMRLMGKDVLIGGSNKEKQTFVRGEESRRRHYPEHHAATDNSLLGRCSKLDRASGSHSSQTPPENVLIQSNPSLQGTVLMTGTGSGFLQSNHVCQQGNLGLNKNISSSNLQWQSTSGAKLKSHISFKSQVLPSPQHTPLPQLELNDRNKHHHHASSSASEFPLMHQGVEEPAKTSLFQRQSATFTTFPPWLLGPTERLPGTSATRSFPQDTRENNFTTPAGNHSAEFRYPPDPCPPPMVAQPPYIPVTPLNKSPHSAVNSGFINIPQVADRVNPNGIMTTTHDHNHHPYTNARKRPASNFIDLIRPNKLQNIAVQGNPFGRMISSTGGSSSAGLQRNAGAVELGSQLNGALYSRQNQTQNLNPASHVGANSILRPSQNMDQNYTRTMNSSAIPNTATTDCDRDLELRRRLTKLHRF